jgi:tetraacyldisaccharide 4'-kinase
MARQRTDSGWPRWWLHRGALSAMLWPLSLLYALATGLRRVSYRTGLRRSARLPVPVVVVGNLTVGGAGKTPVVAALADGLRRHGWHPGIVSRGYGRKSPARSVAVRPDGDPAQCGDEPVLLARLTGCPVQVAARRVQAARDLLAAHPQVDVLLSDDGLQHLALARDVEVVVVDDRLWGNGLLLPAGPLREPPSRRRDATLGPADVLARVETGGRRFALRRVLGDVRHFDDGTRLSWAEFAQRFANQPVAALAGIGHPGQFFAALRTAGLTVQGVALRDHQPLSAAHFSALPQHGPVLITEKDAIKCQRLAPALRERLWVVGLRLELPEDLLPWLCQRLETARGHPTS